MPPARSVAGEALRGFAIVLVILLVAPAGAALKLNAPSAGLATHGVPAAALGDISDGDLVMMLAPLGGHDVTRLPAISAPEADVATLAMRLAERRGQDVSPEDFAVFDALHPDVAVPVATLLTAIDQAWTLRDAAFEGVTREEMLLSMQAEDPSLAQPTNPETLLAAAILLLDTAEAIVIPQLEAAAQNGAWPATAVADPVGVLRVGGTGNDFEAVDRILQVDARGDDVYRNNAGGAQSVNDLRPSADDYPVAMSIDLSGNDDYRFFRQYALGGAAFGVGIALDLAGNDHFECGEYCMGGDTSGVSMLRDIEGEDTRQCFALCLGSGNRISVMRDDGGNDEYTIGGLGLGLGANGPGGVGVLWERAGVDKYQAPDSRYVFGGAENHAYGLFVEEGADFDAYSAHRVASNDHVWQHGSLPGPTGKVYGFGADNRGGMPEAMTRLVSAHAG